MRLQNTAGHVAAVVALADELLIAGHRFAEGVLAENEEEEHGAQTALSFGSIGSGFNGN